MGMIEELKPLLDTRQEFGLQREVDSIVVLVSFLNQLWGGDQNSDKRIKDTLSRYLLDEETFNHIKEKRIKAGRNDNKDDCVESLNEFLRQVLWINPKTPLKSKATPESPLPSADLKKINYFPLSRRFLGEVGSQLQLGRDLYLCLESAIGKDSPRLSRVRNRLVELEKHKEVEEEFIETLLKEYQDEQERPVGEESTKVPNRAKDFSFLFDQMGEDLSALLDLDISVLSKPRMLLYLERLVNLYALLYYLNIITSQINDSGELTPLKEERPLILPICSNEMNSSYYKYSEACCFLYKEKAESFWRKYLLHRVKHNVNNLGSVKSSAKKILTTFLAPENMRKILGFSSAGSQITDRKKDVLQDSISEIIDLLKDGKMSPEETFTESFLRYNLMGQRTLARIRWILDRQGKGAGIVAQGSTKIAYFQVKPELLELLAIIFFNRNSNKDKENTSKLSLRNFIFEMRNRYGIVLGHSKGVEKSIGEQGISIPPRYLLEENLTHLIKMLQNLNMLKSLSDTNMYISHTFPCVKEEKCKAKPR
jgi:hypothetical protein